MKLDPVAALFTFGMCALASTAFIPDNFDQHTITYHIECGDHTHRVESTFTGSVEALQAEIANTVHVRSLIFDWPSDQAPPDDLMLLDALGQPILGPH